MCYSGSCPYERWDGSCRGERSRRRCDALCQTEDFDNEEMEDENEEVEMEDM